MLTERYCNTASKQSHFCEPERRGQYSNERSGASVETARNGRKRACENRSISVTTLRAFEIGKKKRLFCSLIATLWGATCCARLAILLRRVGCCWLKFENGQQHPTCHKKESRTEKMATRTLRGEKHASHFFLAVYLRSRSTYCAKRDPS